MKKIITTLCMTGALIAAVSCKDENRIVVKLGETPELTSEADSLNWAFGFTMAQNFATTGVEANPEIIMQAFMTTLASKQQPMTQEQTMRMLNNLEQLSAVTQMKNRNKDMAESQAREDAYFANLTSQNPNVKKSDKGYYYEVVKEGNGRQAEEGLVALFDYKGSFTNGQVFDQTYGNRDPLRVTVSSDLMEGLFEGLCTMRAGSTYRFYLPSAKAFGARGNGSVPPYTTVIYEVELHEVSDL